MWGPDGLRPAAASGVWGPDGLRPAAAASGVCGPDGRRPAPGGVCGPDDVVVTGPPAGEAAAPTRLACARWISRRFAPWTYSIAKNGASLSVPTS